MTARDLAVEISDDSAMSAIRRRVCFMGGRGSCRAAHVIVGPSTGAARQEPRPPKYQHCFPSRIAHGHLAVAGFSLAFLSAERERYL
jgi:hypothetical protein